MGLMKNISASFVENRRPRLTKKITRRGVKRGLKKSLIYQKLLTNAALTKLTMSVNLGTFRRK